MISDSSRRDQNRRRRSPGLSRPGAPPIFAIFTFLFLLAVAISFAPTLARAAMAVTDSAAIAKLAQQINEMRKQMEELVAIKREAEATAQALGDAGSVILPAVDLARLGYQLHRDMACLMPNWEGLMPTVEFEDIHLQDICSRRDFYRQTLFAGGEEYGRMSLGCSPGDVEDRSGKSILHSICQKSVKLDLEPQSTAPTPWPTGVFDYVREARWFLFFWPQLGSAFRHRGSGGCYCRGSRHRRTGGRFGSVTRRSRVRRAIRETAARRSPGRSAPAL